MQNRRRVAITGIGAVTPIGITVDGMWDGLRRQRSAIRTVTRFDPSAYRSQNAAEVAAFEPVDFMERKRAKRLDRFGHFAVASARLAIEDAELDLAKEDRERIGAMMGSALGGVGYAEEQFGIFLRDGIERVEPQLALNVFVGAASCNVAIEFGLQGPNSTNGMSCASGTISVGDAFRLIRDDYADAMLCGGSEAPIMPLCFGAFTIIRAMSTRNGDPERASRPFDKARDGFVMGEGGAVLVLEEYERARARGARIYAEVVGYGNCNDAHHMTAPRPDASQAARAMRMALADAHVPPTDVAYVNAHGSSTPLNDSTETAAIHQVFGEHATRLQVSSTKGYYGHALGASGAFEIAISALALHRQWLPPTLNLDEAGEGCDLDYIPNAGRDVGAEYAVSNSFGFGGINAAVVLKRPD
ncbi:MAG: beta-ketoacyl-ACP synthase II [Gemmatimonadaceae bacterium]